MDIPETAGVKPAAKRAGSRAATIHALWRAMRPRHWVKNSFVLAGFLFTLNQGGITQRAPLALLAVGCFCLLASAIYLFNDVCDAEADRLHPKKRHRPIAAGALSPQLAVGAAIVLAGGGLGIAWLLGWKFLLAALSYVALTVAYSLALKHLVILDVMAIAAGFVLRAVAGALAIDVEISSWLLICTTLLALLLGLSKRRVELALVDRAADHRRILEQYTLDMLDQMITVVTAATLMAYMLYTFLASTQVGRPALMLTIPFVVYGILRFLYLAQRQEAGGLEELLKDPGILVTVALWGATCGAILLFR